MTPMTPMTGFLIGGTSSGVGKTTVTLALIAAMRRRGLVVQPFKGGPDFLDTGHHTRIAGRTARNLDTWMLSADRNREVLLESSVGADAIVVEGMMGLFDGKDGATEIGSSAEIAKLLQLPVVLVLDAGKSARSIAAMVLGFERFDPDLALAGVILNRVASDRHFTMLQAAITSSCRTPVLGWIPPDPLVAIPERHLGLRTAAESAESAESNDGPCVEHQIDRLADLGNQHIEIDALLALRCGLGSPRPSTPAVEQAPNSGVRIGVAKDRAFSFYYEDNLDLLREQGAEIVNFSPMLDAALPANLDALYLGGGYPELYTSQLSGNTSMLQSVRAFADAGRPIYAECGGMIYLARSLATRDGQKHAMASVLPFSMEMTDKLVQFGYVTVDITQDGLLGQAGTQLRGHSFHYSRMAGPTDTPTSYRLTYSLSRREEDEGYQVGSVLASYIHVHFRTAPGVAAAFVACARSAKSKELAPA